MACVLYNVFKVDFLGLFYPLRLCGTVPVLLKQDLAYRIGCREITARIDKDIVGYDVIAVAKL